MSVEVLGGAERGKRGGEIAGEVKESRQEMGEVKRSKSQQMRPGRRQAGLTFAWREEFPSGTFGISK